jgi:diaminopimelate decarboxylase
MKSTPLPPHLVYRSRQLWMEGVPMTRLLSEVGTPVYLYSRARLMDNFKRFDEAFRSSGGFRHLVLYAMKANSNGAILSLFGKAGAGTDIVSAGELYRARRAGIPPERIVFSGVGKRVDEIRMALEAGILMFNVESLEELHAIDRVAASIHKAAPVSIRVNPDVDAMTHDHITTGKKENKFGIPLEKALPIFRVASKLPRINLLGVQTHIGSQITSTRPFTVTLDRVLELIDKLETEGINLRYIDLGGGLGIRYRHETPPTPKQLAQEIHQKLRGRDITLLLEPGRFLVGDAGILATRVIYRKDVGSKHFVIVDAAMNDLARPALYDAYHEVFPIQQKKGKTVTADIVGPICESGDYLARNRTMVLPEPDDGLIIATAGAYGFAMGSQYNSRPRPPEVLVNGTRWTVVRERETLEDLVRGERIPSDL